MDDRLHVLTTVFNPWRYQTRINLYERFRKYVEDSGGILWTVEVALGDRDFVVTDQGNERHLRLRSDSEMWHKERATNLLIERLPSDWKYIAHVDADVQFSRPDWVRETVELLQHFPTIQMFSQAVDLTPDFEIHIRKKGVKTIHEGLYFAHMQGLTRPGSGRHYEHFHPGYAHAYTRECIDAVGGLFDQSILGAADHFMALSMLGRSHEKSVRPAGISAGYNESLNLWSDRAKRYINGNVGYMPGLLLHYWHGPKVFRRYVDRWQVLTQNQYDPEWDLKRDWQGLWQFTARSPQLKYQTRAYFRQRNEDDISVGADG